MEKFASCVHETVPKRPSPTNGIMWKSLVVLIVVMIGVCQAQTFQYSRGWTNGKRARGLAAESRYPSAQPFDIDVGIVEVPIDEAPVPLRINLSPQLRPRSSDYNQVVDSFKKVGRGPFHKNNNNKQAVWDGTLMESESSGNNNNAEF